MYDATLVSSPRQTEKRKVDFDSRNAAAKRAKLDADTIKNWEDLVAFCKNLNYNINDEINVCGRKVAGIP